MEGHAILLEVVPHVQVPVDNKRPRESVDANPRSIAFLT